MNVDVAYKSFLKYKIKQGKSYKNLLLKVRSLEDLMYAWGLLWFSRKIVFKHFITNETIRGR